MLQYFTYRLVKPILNIVFIQSYWYLFVSCVCICPEAGAGGGRGYSCCAFRCCWATLTRRSADSGGRSVVPLSAISNDNNRSFVVHAATSGSKTLNLPYLPRLSPVQGRFYVVEPISTSFCNPRILKGYLYCVLRF